MCSAAATLGFTTSQFAMTKVFGTLPSVWQAKPNQKKKQHFTSHYSSMYIPYTLSSKVLTFNTISFIKLK